MKIAGARVALDAQSATPKDFLIRGGRICFSDDARTDEPVLDLTGFLLLPGLINAHDHLEFNLFPKLGSGPYGNAKLWAADIYRPQTSPVKEHLSLSKRARLIWGGLKNLLSGVTTVAHHNAAGDALFDDDFPVHVVKKFGWAHSLDFSPDIVELYRSTPADWPFIVHAAEGTDAHAHSEIRRLDELGILSERTVLVHAVGVDPADLELLRERRTSIVWCPSSNLQLYGRTLSAEILHSGLDVALGTDSAMTAQTDLMDELNLAKRVGDLSDSHAYEMVTSTPARLLKLRDGQGSIREAGVADLIAVADRGQDPAAALQDMQLELVMIKGRIRLISPRLMERLSNFQLPLLHAARLDGHMWFTDINLPVLHRETVESLGPHYRLAGKCVAS